MLNIVEYKSSSTNQEYGFFLSSSSWRGLGLTILEDKFLSLFLFLLERMFERRAVINSERSTQVDEATKQT
jgi:hypothetical protein